ncbi:glycosyltransferase family 39 protein [Alicyclobacillus fastidiosus]|uniref:Glycosyltransferase family 39 protein n=1 Tax=Alicyclobacillus fastidiosus TaxID=392011 RepID=A0ABV5ALM4_9BACL
MLISPQKITGHSVLRNLIFLLAINVIIRTAWLLFMHPPQALDFEWYYTHAVQMASGGGYRQGNLYTAYWPIGYPYFLSLLFRITGPSVWAGLIANAILSVMIVMLIYAITLQLAHRPTLSLFAAVGYTVLPSQIEWNAVLGSEELYTMLILASLCVYICAAERNRRLGLFVLISGVILGLSCDVRPISLLFPFAIWVYELWIRRFPFIKATLTLMCMYIGLAIGICPVTIRNAIALHHFILVSTNGGVDLWQGTHVDGSYFWSWNPKINPLLAAGSNQYLEGKIGTHIFIEHVIHHPIWTVIHGVLKWFFLYWVDWNVVGVTFQAFTKEPIQWLVKSAMWFDTIVYWAWMCICAIGAWKGIKLGLQSWKVIALPIAYIAYNTAIFFFFPAWDRFRYPMMPLFAILFGLGIYVIVLELQQRRAVTTVKSTITISQ